MEWHDNAIILGIRQRGEKSAIVELMTCNRGRYLGIVKNGRKQHMQSLIQLGNHVEAHWRARLDEHLGIFHLEETQFLASKIMQIPFALYGIQTAIAHLRLLPERDPHPLLYKGLEVFLEYHETPILFAEILLRFEMLLLEELGFGLDLTCCAATGNKEELAYVSPKSARAVSRAAGHPWKDKLLPLPAFLYEPNRRPILANDIRDGFKLTEFFLSRHIWKPRGFVRPPIRTGFINLLLREFST